MVLRTNCRGKDRIRKTNYKAIATIQTGGVKRKMKLGRKKEGRKGGRKEGPVKEYGMGRHKEESRKDCRGEMLKC